jgi:hypothetical protein
MRPSGLTLVGLTLVPPRGKRPRGAAAAFLAMFSPLGHRASELRCVICPGASHAPWCGPSLLDDGHGDDVRLNEAVAETRPEELGDPDFVLAGLAQIVLVRNVH